MVDIGSNKASRRFLRLILILAGFSVALVAVAVYFSFASAHVVIYPKEEAASTEFTAPIQSAAVDAAALDLVPGRIERVEKEGSKSITQVAEKLIPDYAQVTVTIFNKQSAAQGLLPRTQLLTADGIKFRTDESVNVPAGGSIQVGATADQPGKEGNISPTRFAIIKLSPELQQLVYAESAEAATGGEKPSRAVTTEDIKTAQDTLAEELFTQAQEELSGKLTDTEQLVPEAIAKKIIDQSSSVEPGAAVETFEVRAKVEAATVIFDESGLLQLAIAKLNESLPVEKELVSYDPTSFDYDVKTFDDKKGSAQVSAKLSGVARPRLPQEAFDRNALKGLSKKEVEKRFRGFSEVERVEVRFTPFFAFVVPTIIDNITIEVGKSPSAEAQTATPTNTN